MKQWALLATLATALLVRLPGIDWGLPPTIQEVRSSDLRSSYAFDEDDILSGAARASIARLDFDPHEYHWGMLHGQLVLLTLDGAEALGLFQSPWRSAYYNLLPDGFARVYVVGRLVAVAATLLTIVLLFRLPFEYAGIFAAMLIAVSPSHMLQSDQVRVDVTMTALLALTLLAAMRTEIDARPRRFVFLGIAGGLSIAAKYSAVTAVATIALATLALNRFRRRSMAAVLTGVLLGFIAGEPFILSKPGEIYQQINRYAISTANSPPEFASHAGELVAQHVINLARFSMGPIALVLADVGLTLVLRRRAGSDWLILAGIAGYIPMLWALRSALIRYDLPLTLFLGLAAGIALERFPKGWRYAFTAPALVMPLAGCFAQIHYMRAPHPANVMLERILETVPPGIPISRLFPESPPLDRKVYPEGPNVFTGDLATNPPVWMLVDDLPVHPYKPSTLALIQSSYKEIARADSQRILAWSTLGERAAPHDWKYTHPTFILYQRKSQ